MSTRLDAGASAGHPIPRLFAGLIADAAVFPPGNAAIDDAVTAYHRDHLTGWYAPLLGPLLLPASALAGLRGADLPALAVVVDTGMADLPAVVAEATGFSGCRQLEIAVAKRGEDPQPGLANLVAAGAGRDLTLYAELPLTFGLLGALDTIAERRAAGMALAPKFRTGGLAAELFPTPMELAAVIAACQDRQLPFKLTAGLHHALRRTDPATGFVHHGFLNVLAAAVAAADGAEVAELARLLGDDDPLPVVELIRAHREQPRPGWVEFGSCSVAEPLADLASLGLIAGETDGRVP